MKGPIIQEHYFPCGCYECGKIFYPPVREEWVFKRYVPRASRDSRDRTIYFCSWSCLRKYEREFVPPQSRQGRKKAADV